MKNVDIIITINAPDMILTFEKPFGEDGWEMRMVDTMKGQTLLKEGITDLQVQATLACHITDEGPISDTAYPYAETLWTKDIPNNLRPIP
jgi:hypothetical protein